MPPALLSSAYRSAHRARPSEVSHVSAGGGVQGVVRPEQEAVVWATAAASLSASQEERAAALLRLGEAVAFQFFCRMPGGFLNFSAWTPLVVAPAPAPAQQQVQPAPIALAPP